MRFSVSSVLLPALCCSMLPVGAWAEDYFTIRVVDSATGRGVPLVELTTVHQVTYVTDSAGVVAFYEPGLMDQEVFFRVQSHGYRYQKDGFGYTGARLKISPGGEATIKLQRVNVAERLYRVTGGGVYCDSQLLGHDVPLHAGVLNGQVLGSDSVVNAVCRGKLFWFWGDTNRPSYPLGNFHVPGAVSQLPGSGGLDPAVGVDLQYFLDDNGFAKSTCKMPGDGPTWIEALVALGPEGSERLFAIYVKIKPPLTVYRRGVAEFDFARNQFEPVSQFDLDAPAHPSGHPFVIDHGDGPYVYFGNPFPVMRVRATPSAVVDLSQYEVYTCVSAGGRAGDTRVERTSAGPQFAWKTDAPAFTAQLQQQLIRRGQLQREEGLYQLQDEAGKPIMIHRGSVCWNDYRRRWIMIAAQVGGSSELGEIWYAESPELTGPWRDAKTRGVAR